MPRRPPFSYPRAEMQARVLARLEGGYSVKGLRRLGGYPSHETIYRWAREDPGFAAAMDRARARWRGETRARRLAQAAYDEDRADAFVRKVRRGHAIRDLVKAPGQPSYDLLRAWKRQRPEFARVLARAVRFSRATGGAAKRPKPYDEAVADQIVLRVSKGEARRDVEREPGMPGRANVDRWRREEPGFAYALRVAGLSHLRHAMTAQRRSNPALTARIVAHIRRGGSLLSAARRVKGAPYANHLYAWMRTRPAFAQAVKAAEMERDDRLADRVLDIAERATPETLAADRLRMGLVKKRLGQVSGGRPRSLP
jgi:hypothetical protein